MKHPASASVQKKISRSGSGIKFFYDSGPARCLLLLLLLVTALQSCRKDSEDLLPDPIYLVESLPIAGFSTVEIMNKLISIGDVPQEVAFLLQHDISVYRIIYNTVDISGDPVLASGAVIVPQSDIPLPMISFQHGTITSDEEAPSYFSGDDHFIAAVYASAGNIIVLPDYLGYGSSKHLDHPYEHGSSLATASRDMIRAVREFDLWTDEFRADDRLFLTGYSQGGYATMALLKLLEENHVNEFRVTAATAGAGAYNKTMFARHILEYNGNLTYMNYFLWVLDTYNKIYGINRPYNYIFKEPYAQIIEEGGVFANAELNPAKLFRSDFRNAIFMDEDQEFINAITDNDNFDWKPSTPLQLYHGTDDDFVFYFNSTSAYEAMIARGVNRVELITVQGGNHSTTLADYLTGTFLFFSSF